MLMSLFSASMTSANAKSKERKKILFCVYVEFVVFIIIIRLLYDDYVFVYPQFCFLVLNCL